MLYESPLWDLYNACLLERVVQVGYARGLLRNLEPVVVAHLCEMPPSTTPARAPAARVNLFLASSLAASSSESKRSAWTSRRISKRELSKRAFTDFRMASCCWKCGMAASGPTTFSFSHP